MSSPVIRQFGEPDAEQLTALVNAHVAAVVPNVAVATSSLLTQLARDPHDFLVEPWVAERDTLVAEHRGRIVAAAHLCRYDGSDTVPESHRGAAEIRWLLFWPSAPYWPDSADAAMDLMSACLDRLAVWSATTIMADGTLPAPGVYGVPEQWPHVLGLLKRTGFAPDRAETVHLARVQDIPRQLRLPVRGLRTSRTVGSAGVRISAVIPTVDTAEARDGVLGYIEVDTALDAGNAQSAFASWADVGNLEVGEFGREQSIDRWLLGQAADWLELGGVSRVLAFTETEDGEDARVLDRTGFSILTRTQRGFVKN